MNKYTAAVIGTGRIGFTLQFDTLREQPASHAAALNGNSRTKLIAGCDIDPDKEKPWRAAYPDSAFYCSAEQLFETQTPDIVCIAVNETSHRAVAETVIKHSPRLIILEKPVAPNLEAAEKIRSIAKKHNVPVLVNHERRGSSDYIRAKQLLKNNAIGDIHSVHAQLWSGAAVWKKEAFRDGSCSLIHDGTHMIDILRFLLDADCAKPVIDFTEKNKKHEIRALHCHYTIRKNIFCSIDFSGNKRVFHFQIEICGSDGKLVIGNGIFSLYRRKKSPFYAGFYSMLRDSKISPPAKTGYFSNMIKNGIAFLDNKTPLLSPLAEGIGTLKNLYAIINQLR